MWAYIALTAATIAVIAAIMAIIFATRAELIIRSERLAEERSIFKRR